MIQAISHVRVEGGRNEEKEEDGDEGDEVGRYRDGRIKILISQVTTQGGMESARVGAGVPFCGIHLTDKPLLCIAPLCLCSYVNTCWSPGGLNKTKRSRPRPRLVLSPSPDPDASSPFSHDAHVKSTSDSRSPTIFDRPPAQSPINDIFPPKPRTTMPPLLHHFFFAQGPVPEQDAE